MLVKKEIPFLVNFMLMIGYFFLVAGISVSSIPVMLFFGTVAFYISMKSLKTGVCLIMFSLPFLGEAQEILSIRAVPLGPLLIFSSALGYSWKILKTEKSKLFIGFSRALILFGSAILFSAFIGFARSVWELRMSGDMHIFLHQAGWVFLFTLIPLSGLSFYFLLTIQGKDYHLKYFIVLLSAVSLSAVIVALEYFGLRSPNSVDKFLPLIEGRYDGTYVDPNAMGMVASILIPLWLASFFEKGKKRVLVLGFTLFFLLFAAGSRSSFFVFFPATIVFLFFIKSNVKRLIGLGVLFACMFFLFFLIKMDSKRSLNARSTAILEQLHVISPPQHNKDFFDYLSVQQSLQTGWHFIVDQRWPLWKAGWVTFRHHWILGVGAGRYLIDMPKYKEEIGAVVNDNPGNMYLHVAAEQGILGLFAFFYVIYRCFKDFIRQSQRKIVEEAALSTIVGLLVSFVFGAHLVNSEVNILFWFLLAIISVKMGVEESNVRT